VSRRERADSGTLVFGWHAAERLVASAPDAVREMLVLEGRDDERARSLRERAAEAGVDIRRVPRKRLDELADGSHQGVVARLRPREPEGEGALDELLDHLEGPPFLLILDGVQDPHNLGACLRSADGAGVHAVVVPRDRAAGLTATVRKVACGAAETTRLIRVTNLARTLRHLKARGLWLVGTAEDAPVTVFEADWTGPLGLVMGGEGRGLRRLTREACDTVVSLPMRGVVESLNVSVATGICLYTALGRRSTGQTGDD
jgi:23S rRNA (guanosine2251-2'-O)-methyltransferase